MDSRIVTKLYDTNNYARKVFERSSSGLPLRELFDAAYFEPEPAVFFFDGPGAKAPRLALYPEYKAKRVGAPDNFYIILRFFEELLAHTNNVIVKVPGVEADDVIATYVRANPEGIFEIESTDRDFGALHRAGVTQPNANMKGVPADEVRLHKTLLGDTSDNIPGLVKFGPKAWEALTPEHKANWVKHLEGGEVEHPNDLGLTKVIHITNWMRDMELLRIYWKIIGFFDVPMDTIAKNMRLGTKNYDLANQKMKASLM